MNCLLHVPGSDLPPIIARIRSVLRSGGLFYLGTWGGDGTEEVDANEWHDPPRFFTWRTMARSSARSPVTSSLWTRARSFRTGERTRSSH
ncbi:methyltransferase domain-containing protein [Tenggerimyces flavus]|uniref:Uncharacterized protein n=1 Tax=Tenggerimyces flavus TaxID=1708749 RepID=A0ABV7Y4F2_9ACTN